MRVLIVGDDNTLSFIKNALPSEWHNEVVIVKDVEQANQLLASDPPQLAVLNCSLPQEEITPFCAALKERFTNFTYVILLSDGVIHNLPTDSAIGADKDLPAQKDLLKAIAQGIQKRNPAPAKEGPSRIEAPLTTRQLEILKLMSQGLSNQEIAAAIGVTTGTVKSHVNQIFEKLSVHSRSKAIVSATLLGLI